MRVHSLHKRLAFPAANKTPAVLETHVYIFIFSPGVGFQGTCFFAFFQQNFDVRVMRHL